MSEAIWLLSIGLYTIRQSDAMLICGFFLLSENDSEIGLLLMSESGS
jgi:hypothetical protein